MTHDLAFPDDALRQPDAAGQRENFFRALLDTLQARSASGKARPARHPAVGIAGILKLFRNERKDFLHPRLHDIDEGAPADLAEGAAIHRGERDLRLGLLEEA